VPYNTSELERDVALSLGIPMYGADPRLAPLGSKTGCRRMFADVDVPHPLGVENLRTLDDLADAVVAMRSKRPSMDSAIVKLNDGVSGQGNALVRLSGLPVPGTSGERTAVMERLRVMELESKTTPLDVYLDKFARGSGVIEERITGEEIRSPSVQLRVLPDGAVELLSTHDQLLGGASGQSYLGCTFPAAPEYARAITQHAETIGQRLAREGALGRFAVDFVVVRGSNGDWTPYAIELNLRKGGTTHPFLTLQFLTDGRYDPVTALFLTPRGHEKHLVATDHLESELLRGLAVSDLFDIVARHGLHFDQSRQVGIVFHMISCLTERGRIGLTAVGDTPTEADRRYRDAERVLLDEARLALEESPLPVEGRGCSSGRGTSPTARTWRSLASVATCPEDVRPAVPATTLAASTRANPPELRRLRCRGDSSSPRSREYGVEGWPSTTASHPTSRLPRLPGDRRAVLRRGGSGGASAPRW
jgi:hypothetical protein